MRKVIQKILDENLDRQHRQEWQEGTGSHHTEHITEVGTGSHLDVFDDVSKGLPSFEYAGFQYQQVFLEQNDVCTFLGDVDG